jgi:uncharacterized protein YozE (UPF0346 family)
MNFIPWLLKQKKRDDQIGDLARDMNDDVNRPDDRASVDAVRDYLVLYPACGAAMEVFEAAVCEYKSINYLKSF